MEIIKTNYKMSSTENALLTGYLWSSKENMPDSEAKDPKAVILLCHGMAEYIDRYNPFANFLVENGFVVYGFNHRGHKGSILTDEDYGYMSDQDNFDAMLTDIDGEVELAESEYPGKDIFIFGHSMGSFITQRYIELHPNKVKGAIVCGTGMSPKGILGLGRFFAKCIMNSKGRRHRSKFINGMAFGSYNNKFEKRTEYDWLNRKQEEVDKYIADKYCGGIFTVSFFYDFFGCLKAIQENFELIPKELPILLISGSMDPVGGYSKQVKNLYNKLKKIGINDIDMILYQNARHEILMEIDHEQTFKDVLGWLEKHL